MFDKLFFALMLLYYGTYSSSLLFQI